ncbi:hypothetical protein PN499_27915 [Kamptonema animale CS-326]|nr:hypothetical protein [Kamptonema animale CS-326]
MQKRRCLIPTGRKQSRSVESEPVFMPIRRRMAARPLSLWLSLKLVVEEALINPY